jgi:hypothetical protein
MRGFALFTIAPLLIVGCEKQSEYGEGLCESAFTVTILAEGAGVFPRGIYGLDVEADGARRAYECIVDKAMECRSGDSTIPVESLGSNFETHGLRVKVPAAARITVTFRAHCPTAVLATETFSPSYTCEECRQGAATMTAKVPQSSASALIICPDAGGADGG